jgi:hypothetical protein
LEIATLAQFVRHVCRHILRPLLGGVEGDDADRIFVLALEQTKDDGFQIRRLDIGLAPGAAVPAKVVNNELQFLIVTFRHDRGVQPVRGITQEPLRNNGTEIKFGLQQIVPPCPRNRRSEGLATRVTSARLLVVVHFAVTTAFVSIAACRRHELQFFRRQGPIDRALGLCHRFRLGRSLAGYGLPFEREPPFP